MCVHAPVITLFPYLDYILFEYRDQVSLCLSASIEHQSNSKIPLTDFVHSKKESITSLS